MCVYLWEKEGSKFRTECGGDRRIASAVHMSVVQLRYTLTENVADWLFFRLKLDFFILFFLPHTALVQWFYGNYVNYMSYHCLFSTSFDLTFKTNKRIIIFMGNLCFMV